MERTAAIADHKGVRDDRPAAEIDRLEAGLVPIYIVGACLTSSKVGRGGSHQKPVPKVIDLGVTTPAVKRTEDHHNIRYCWCCRNCENREGVIPPQHGVAADEIVASSCPSRTAHPR